MKSMTDSLCRQGEKEEGEEVEQKERGGEKSLQQLWGCLVFSTVTTTRELSTEFDVFSSLVEVMPHSEER